MIVLLEMTYTSFKSENFVLMVFDFYWDGFWVSSWWNFVFLSTCFRIHGFQTTALCDLSDEIIGGP